MIRTPEARERVKRRMSPKKRLAIFTAADGRCQGKGCGVALPFKGSPGKPGWHADHINPLWISRDDELTNFQALCRPCHDLKTATQDQPRIAKTKRQQKMMLPREKSRRPIRSRGFDKSRSRTFSGEVVVRPTTQEVRK